MTGNFLESFVKISICNFFRNFRKKVFSATLGVGLDYGKSYWKKWNFALWIWFVTKKLDYGQPCDTMRILSLQRWWRANSRLGFRWLNRPLLQSWWSLQRCWSWRDLLSRRVHPKRWAGQPSNHHRGWFIQLRRCSMHMGHRLRWRIWTNPIDRRE